MKQKISAKIKGMKQGVSKEGIDEYRNQHMKIFLLVTGISACILCAILTLASWDFQGRDPPSESYTHGVTPVTTAAPETERSLELLPSTLGDRDILRWGLYLGIGFILYRTIIRGRAW
jgi:hypothetical protein